MIHNERERLAAKDQLEYLRSELEKRSEGEHTEATHGVISALRAQISILEEQLAEYEYLKEGLTKVFEADSLDEFGDLVTKARIARGWSQAELAKVLEMEPQQIQRYEKNDWQKISLWRLQEIVEALGLGVAIHAWLHDHEGQSIEPPRVMYSYGGLHQGAKSTLGLGTGEVLDDVDAVSGKVLGTVGVVVKDAFRTLPTAISNVEYRPSGTPDASQAIWKGGGWGVSRGNQGCLLCAREERAGTPGVADIPIVSIWQGSESD